MHNTACPVVFDSHKINLPLDPKVYFSVYIDDVLQVETVLRTEKKIRRRLIYTCESRGFRWIRSSRALLYESVGLYIEYGVRYSRAQKNCLFKALIPLK